MYICIVSVSIGVPARKGEGVSQEKGGSPKILVSPALLKTFTLRGSLRGCPERPPLPLGEGRGEGSWGNRRNGGAASAAENPHPNPLPEGEGTCSALLSGQPLRSLD